ncbi:MAG: TlpA family protein disulfide reductase [Cyanobacteria bacterium REEB67]|nr:TlpA family protein disulfide reductase [Cyanobacteria bacterium REEB67]
MQKNSNLKAVAAAGDQQANKSRQLVNFLRPAIALCFALGWGSLAMLCLQDYDRAGECLPQHIWFMLLVTIGASAAFGFLCRRAIFGAVLGAVLGINFQFIFLPHYTMGYSYWEPRPEAEKIIQEIAGPLLGGGLYDIKNCQGKVLLVDYWATWCGPCVASIPKVKQAFKDKNGQGLDVVGISLDNKRQNLQDFVEKNDLKYPQIFFEEESKSGYDNPLALKYKVAAIPHAVLVEPKSKMVLTVVPNSRDLQWTIDAALKAVSKAEAKGLDMTKYASQNRLATFSLSSYIAGLAGGLAGALLELFAWRRLSPPRPKLRRVK